MVDGVEREREQKSPAWARNANGNLVAQLRGQWVTVYRTGSGFRFVMNHIFSRENFTTEAAACAAVSRDERIKRHG